MHTMSFRSLVNRVKFKFKSIPPNMIINKIILKKKGILKMHEAIVYCTFLFTKEDNLSYNYNLVFSFFFFLKIYKRSCLCVEETVREGVVFGVSAGSLLRLLVRPQNFTAMHVDVYVRFIAGVQRARE